MIINKEYNHNATEVLNLGYSDHFAQILFFMMNKQKDRMENITRRNFSRKDTEKFKYLWEKESLAEIYLINDLNDSYKLFFIKFVYYFESAFPIKTYYKKEDFKNIKCRIKGIKASCQNMRFVNNLKRNLSLTRKILNYINKYHSIYKTVISEEKKIENDKLVKCAKKTCLR